MWQTKEKLTPEQWYGIFTQTAQAFQAMAGELQQTPNWKFVPDLEEWKIPPGQLDQLPKLEKERGHIKSVARIVASRPLASGEMDKNYHGVKAQCSFSLRNRDPKVLVTITAPHHRELKVAPEFIGVVGREIIGVAEKHGLTAPRQIHPYSDGLEHVDQAFAYWELVHSSHPRAKR